MLDLSQKIPPCEICGEQDVVCQNGLFFCVGCNTQSQQFVEEEQDDLEETATQGNTYTIHKTKGPDSGGRNKNECGRPWKTVEGFTVILREQVSALLKLGADPRFKEVVFRLWCLFMRKSGHGLFGPDEAITKIGLPLELIADNEKREEKTKQRTSRSNLINLSERDIYLPLPSHPEIDMNARYKKKIMKRGTKRKRNQDKEQQAMMISAVGGEEFYSEDNPLLTTKEVSVLDMLMEEEDQLEQSLIKKGTSLQQKLNEYQECIERISLKHTLALCYLGLKLTTRTLILPLDLLKLVRDKTLPFKNGHCFFPNDMRMVFRDWDTFGSDTVDLGRFQMKLGRVLKFLDLTPFPNLEVGKLVARFIFELNLPGDLHTVVMGLLDIHHISLDYKDPCYLCKYPNMVMAYIVIALKTILRFDGNLENKLSEFTEIVLEVLGTNSHYMLFNWKKWLAYQASRLPGAVTRVADWKFIQNTDCIEQLISEYNSNMDKKEYVRKLSVYRQQAPQNIIKIFGQLSNKVSHSGSEGGTGICMSGLDDDEDVLENDDEIFPADEDELCEEYPPQFTDLDEGNTPRVPSVRTVNVVDPDPVTDFTKQSVLHLTNWEEFLGHLESGGVTEHSFYESCAETDQAETELKYKSRSHAAVRRIVLDKASSVKPGLIEKLRNIADMLPDKASDGYVRYKAGDIESVPVEHMSYRWLVQVAAVHVGLTEDELHQWVQRVELVILPHIRSAYNTGFKAMYYKTYVRQ